MPVIENWNQELTNGELRRSVTLKLQNSETLQERIKQRDKAMPHLKDIKKRIKTVQEIGQITRAMKTMASARIRPAEARMKKARLYEEKIWSLVKELVYQINPQDSPFLVHREPKNYALIVVTPDTGFCGAYAHNIIHSALDFIEVHNPGKDLFIFALGQKIVSTLKRWNVPMEISIPKWKADLVTSKVLLDTCRTMVRSGQVDRVLILYSKPSTGSGFQAFRETLIPLPLEKLPQDKITNFLIEPSPLEAVNTIFPHYLQVKIHRMLCETRAGELASRVQSMTSATDNAQNLEKGLTLQYFRARQESITQEIIEITSGAEALKEH